MHPYRTRVSLFALGYSFFSKQSTGLNGATLTAWMLNLPFFLLLIARMCSICAEQDILLGIISRNTHERK